jgi:hypothetical protein
MKSYDEAFRERLAEGSDFVPTVEINNCKEEKHEQS